MSGSSSAGQTRAEPSAPRARASTRQVGSPLRREAPPASRRRDAALSSVTSKSRRSSGTRTTATKPPAIATRCRTRWSTRRIASAHRESSEERRALVDAAIVVEAARSTTNLGARPEPRPRAERGRTRRRPDDAGRVPDAGTETPSACRTSRRCPAVTRRPPSARWSSALVIFERPLMFGPWPPRRADRASDRVGSCGGCEARRADPTRCPRGRASTTSRASPLRARSLFTVRAAISSAASSDPPRSSTESLMCSY